jgi:thioredoxin 1
MDTDTSQPQPTREELERVPGTVMVQFGTGWCTYCQALAPHLASALRKYPQVRLIEIEDGKGKPLGRSFGVKLWPTLVFMRDGTLVSQLVRPTPKEVEETLAAFASPPNNA